MARLLSVALVAFSVLRAPIPASAASGVPSVTDQRYFAGVNVAWYVWACDFGCPNGVASKVTQSAISDGFARVQAAGVHAVRWWTFEGDPAQITRDSTGAPTGLNPAVYTDFDAALALAAKYDLAYDFVLFSGPTQIPTAWETDPKQRQKLADALAPLFERYKNDPHILSWELFNEPEFDIWNNKIPQNAVQATIKVLASTIHAHTSNAVTVGSATLEGVPLWAGLGLDFYSPHWYDQMNSGLACARCLDVPTLHGAYGFDTLPITIGEYYGGPDTDTTAKLTDLRRKGFSGAWAWSLFYDKTGDKMQVDLNAISKFTANPGAPPSSAAVQLPTSNGQPTVQLLANWVSPTYLSAGNAITVNQDTISDQNVNLGLNVEVDNQQGQQVLASHIDNQALTAQQVSSLSTTLQLPDGLAPGLYQVKTSAVGQDGSVYAQSDSAGQFTIAAPTPSLVPSPVPDNSGDSQGDQSDDQ